MALFAWLEPARRGVDAITVHRYLPRGTVHAAAARILECGKVATADRLAMASACPVSFDHGRIAARLCLRCFDGHKREDLLG